MAVSEPRYPLDSVSGTARAAGRARTQIRMINAERMNVAASTSSEVRTPKKATTAPPTTKPSAWANWSVVSVMAVPTSYRSPARMSG